ncbi:MAG: acylphosphatase [Chloroflexi bacterium]|nr:acylphosphatase [Chloroflexota bacterium]
MSAERLTARIHGQVQGVGFRWWVRREAQRLDLSGWVMNADDERTVELLAEGEADALDELERLIGAGPSGARVDSVEVSRGTASGVFDGFGIVKP